MKRLAGLAALACVAVALPVSAQPLNSANITIDVPVSIKSFAYPTDRKPTVAVACAASNGAVADIITRNVASVATGGATKLTGPNEAFGSTVVPLTPGASPASGSLTNAKTVYDSRTGRIVPATYYAYDGTVTVTLQYYAATGGAGFGFDPVKSRSWQCSLLIDGLKASDYNNLGSKNNSHYFEDASLKGDVSGFFN